MPKTILTLLLCLGCGGAVEPASAPQPVSAPQPASTPPAEPAAAELDERPSVDPIAAAVAAEGRPDADRQNDAGRRPADVLEFFGIAPGMQVADLMCGTGYYTEILGRLVGPQGKVYCQNNAFVVKRFADGPLKERLAKPELASVLRVDAELERPGLPTGLDAALMFLFYHDTFWQKTDRATMNKAIFDSLKPGGTFGIIDHHAEPGSGERDVKTLHRVDAELVKKEILAAGFQLDAESELLRNPSDDRKKNVFDPEIRRKTDRFIYRFRKPVK